MINVPTPNYYQSGNAGGSGQTISGVMPGYYNTFVNPQLGQQWNQYNNQQMYQPLNGSGPSWQGQQQQFGDQGSGKMGYGSQQNPYSAQRNLQNRQQLDQVVLGVANQGLTGQAGIDAINKQMGYDTGAVWDTQRGNYDIGTGGPNGIQYDRSGGGQYGAHEYNDAGMPAQSGGMQGTSPSGQQNQNDPNAWRRQWAMRGMQKPNYSGGSPYSMYPGSNYNTGSMMGQQYNPAGMQYLQGTTPQSGYGQIPGITNKQLNQPY